ncbi:YybH family protein [Cupriavidus oxalaticus]|uniref:YybH family protein n=1 Tax=Cupriavidus oxalaticus TaxID=96344 RepID=UPI003181C06F
MPRFARLFDSAEDIVEAFREALKLRDAEGALRLWLDEDSITCVLPDGQRMIGHEQLRHAFSQLLEEQPVLVDAIETSSHASMAVSIFDVTEALRFGSDRVEADLYVHTTYVLMQNHEGWRLAHIHCSPANAVQVAGVAAAPGQALH